MIELAVGHNGIERFVRRRGAAARGPATRPTAPGPGARRPGRGPAGDCATVDNVPVGPLRLADRHLAGQVCWLLPLALVGVAAVAARAERRWPLDPVHQAALLWAGWALTYAVVYSYAGGIFHAYYLVTMAPPLAALAGVAVMALWSWYRQGGRKALLLPAVLLLTAAWQLFIWYGDLAGIADDRSATGASGSASRWSRACSSRSASCSARLGRRLQRPPPRSWARRRSGSGSARCS